MPADVRAHVVSRRAPIVTTVEIDGEKLTFDALPIPRWRARNDFGNLIVVRYTDAMNSWVHGYSNENGEFLLSGEMFEHAMPYDELFDWGYGTYDSYDHRDADKAKPTPASDALHAAFESLDFDGMILVLEAALEVNGLETQSHMIDPRKKVPSLPTSLPSLTDDAGQKMESSAASG